MEAIFEGKLETCDPDPECEVKQDRTSLQLPEYLFSEVEQFVIKELTMSMQIPADELMIVKIYLDNGL